MKERTETVVLEAGDVVLKIVASYRLTTERPKQRMRMRSPELGDITASFEGEDSADFMPQRIDAVYTLRLSNLALSQTVELQLDRDTLAALQQAIGKVTSPMLHNY